MEERYKKAVDTRMNNNSYKHSEEQKKKASNSVKKAHQEKEFGFKKDHDPWNKGLPRDEKTKKKLSKATKKQLKEKGHPMEGKRHSEESKKKISKNRTGKSKREERWNWKGGVTPKNRLIRTNSKWRDWRKKVFERDGYTCQNKNCPYCKNKKGIKNLHPHHIEPICIAPNLCFEVSNGITLCSEYHLREVHGNGK